MTCAKPSDAPACPQILCSGLSQYGVLLELEAFEETRTPWDGRRLANALEHICGLTELADAVRALCEGSPQGSSAGGGECQGTGGEPGTRRGSAK